MYLSRGITRFSPFSKEKIAPDWVSTSRAGDDLRLETNQSDLNCGTNMTIGSTYYYYNSVSEGFTPKRIHDEPDAPEGRPGNGFIVVWR